MSKSLASLILCKTQKKTVLKHRGCLAYSGQTELRSEPMKLKISGTNNFLCWYKPLLFVFPHLLLDPKPARTDIMYKDCTDIHKKFAPNVVDS